MNAEAKAKIEAVLRTLDKISVTGRSNMDMLLGCMVTLEGILREEDAENNG